MDDAIPLADRLLAQDPNNRPAHLVRAVNLLVKKDYAGANAEVSDPGGGVFNALTNSLIQAWALAGLGQTDDALKTLGRLQGQMGVEGLYAYHKALILDYAGRDTEADAAYRDALTILGTGPRAADSYGSFLRRHGRSDEAKALYARMVAQNAGNPTAEVALADILANKMPVALVATPAQGAAEGMFAVAASLNGDNGTSVAILYLNLALYLRPDFDLARALLGDRYERNEQLDMADAVYSKVPATSPYHAMVAVQSAIDESRLGMNDQAIAKMKTLAAERPNDGDVWTALGDLLRSVDRYAEAAPAYDKALALTPKGDARVPSLLYARGICLQHINRWDDAERDFRQALALNPNRADVLNYLGYSMVDQGRNLDEAVMMLEKARTLRPLDGYIADSVGWAYYKLGRYAEALLVLEEAVQLAPAASEINDHLGDAYWRVGRKIDARFEWSHALSLDPEPTDKPNIERKLQIGLDAAKASGS
jgi:Flp pilus assembly protein TadD